MITPVIPSIIDEEIKLLKRTVRLLYGAVMAFVTFVVWIAGGPKAFASLSQAIQEALKAVDPFVLTYRWWHKTLWEMGTVDELFRAGWLGLALIVAGAVTIYAMLRASKEGKPLEPGEIFFQWWWSFVLSGLIAVPLQWLLTILVDVLGQTIGFLFWFNGLIAAIIEGIMKLHKMANTSQETIETVKAWQAYLGKKQS